jgi:hypothetical protein
MTFIYTLEHPLSHRIRYVGKTNDIIQRLTQHIKGRCATAKSRWIQSIVSKGLKPVIAVLDEVPESEWKAREQYWIAQMKAWGFDLLNGDEGGLGTGRITSEIRRKISATLRGRRPTSRFTRCASYGKDGRLVAVYPSITDAAIAVGAASHANICIAARKNRACRGFLLRTFRGRDACPDQTIVTPYNDDGRFPDLVRRAKISASNKGRKPPLFSCATRLKMRLARLGKPPANKGTTVNEDGKAKMRERAAMHSKAVIQTDMSGNVLTRWSSVKYASEQTGATRCGIARCCKGLVAHAAGYKWKFADRNILAGLAGGTGAA